MNKNKQKDSTPKNGAQRTETPQERFLMAGVGVFLKNGDLSQMQIQNDYGIIVVKRTTPNGKTETRAIGFAVDDCEDCDEDEENEQDEQETVNKFVRWL